MFFIFDCNDQIVGNPKGYKTHKGAQTQCNLDKSKPTKTMALLWDRFHAKAQIDGTKTRIYSIRWVDQPKPKKQVLQMLNALQSIGKLQIIHVK